MFHINANTARKTFYLLTGTLLLLCSCQQQIQKIHYHTLVMEKERQAGQRDKTTLRSALRYDETRRFSPLYWYTVHIKHPELEQSFNQELQRYLSDQPEAKPASQPQGAASSGGATKKKGKKQQRKSQTPELRYIDERDGVTRTIV